MFLIFFLGGGAPPITILIILSLQIRVRNPLTVSAYPIRFKLAKETIPPPQQLLHNNFIIFIFKKKN